jgi:plastocyanin
MRFVARRSVLALVAFLAGLALAAVPTLGANVNVTSGGGSNTFSPKTVTVTQGDSVTWTNASGSHNVKFDDGLFEEPSSPSSANWTRSRTFTAVGTFRYYCELHGSSGGSGMSGTVVVNAPSGTTTSPPPPGGGGGSNNPGGGGAGSPTGQPPAGDTVAPKLRLSVSAGQRILKRRGLVIKVAADEEGTVTASAKITLPGASKVLELRKVTRQLQANSPAKLKLRLPRRTAPLASALRRRSRLKAKVTVGVQDAAGNSRSINRSVTIKR